MIAQINNIKKIASFVLGLVISLSSFHACYDSDDVGDNFYTFIGQTVGSYIEENPESYSEFGKAIEVAGLSKLLKTYNKYTCFAPTNEAMLNYYSSNGVSSLEELADSTVRYMVYSHLIADKVYETIDFSEGAISSTNMNSRFLTIKFEAGDESVNYIVNTNSTIIESDVEVENGILHIIDRVLTPSTEVIPTTMNNDDRIKLFTEALFLTGLSDSLQLVRDLDFIPEENPQYIARNHNGGAPTNCRGPQERKFGYTVFVESDEVFAANGIYTINDLKAYAASIYDIMYPEDANIDDVKNRRNSLNRFIAYHLIDKTVYYNNFFYKANMASDALLYEFMETFCPNTIFKVSNENGNVNINRDVVRGVDGIIVYPIEGDYEQDTENGVYHLISDILVYDQKVKTMLLNTRIRMDAASLHPELMTMGYRYEKGDNAAGVTGAENYYKLNDDFLKNLQILSTSTRFYYMQGTNSSEYWVNYQADEMMATGQYDFILRLPPVPAGTYEVRFGYSANSDRAVTQFYIDGVPKGIPLDLRIIATDARIGWVLDSDTDDEGIENDKMMKNRGYMKGGTSYMGGSVTARARSGAIRRIISTETWTEDAPHYVRFKATLEDSAAECMIDFIEIVPKNLYENSAGTAEPKD